MAEETKKDLSQMTEEEIDNLKYQSDSKEEEKEESKKEDNSKDSETKEKPKEKPVSEMTKEEIEELKYQTEEKKQKALDRIIRGYNDTFIKHYNFEELDLTFTIKLRLPNMLEQGQISALRSKYLGGTDVDQPAYIYYAFEMLATIQVVGEEVPKYFKNESDIYNPAPLIQMYNDWMEFQSTFRY